METSTEILGDISLDKIRTNIVRALKETIARKLFLFFALLVGGLIGGAYSYLKPTNYTASTSFIVEEKSISGGNIASLAGQFGLDIGGLSGSSGLFSVENIQLVFNSASMQKQILLTQYDDSSKVTLADKYAEIYRLKKKWKSDSEIGVTVNFSNSNGSPLTRLQDSLIYVIIERISKKGQFNYTRPDKKTNFVIVNSKFKDEKLAKLFSERILLASIEKFLSIKTSRQSLNIQKLQRRSDSLLALLNAKSYQSAGESERLLDMNPALRTMTVRSEISSRDKVVLGTLFQEVTKNLEVSKLILSQETPTIQIIDPVKVPTDDDHIKLKVGVPLGALIFLFLAVIVLFIYHLSSPITTANIESKS
jgi:hypothetical protein